MVKKVSIQSTKDLEFRYRMMRQTIEAVYEYHEDLRGKLWMPLLNLIATFIDGLASGTPGKSKDEYLEYLKKNFSDLCADLGAEVFYTYYRCKAVHEFSIEKPFVIEIRHKIGDAYAERVVDDKTDEERTALNIERLVEDFLTHVRSLEASLKGSSGPPPTR